VGDEVEEQINAVNDEKKRKALARDILGLSSGTKRSEGPF